MESMMILHAYALQRYKSYICLMCLYYISLIN